MKNSPWCLRIQVYFFKIHSKSDNFLPHSTIFYLYCCNKFPTSFFFFLFLPLYSLLFTYWTAWSFKNAYHITFLLYFKYSTSFPFTCNKTQVSPNGLPSPVWSGPCLPLSDLVFYHIPLFTGFQHHWFCGSPNTWNFCLFWSFPRHLHGCLSSFRSQLMQPLQIGIPWPSA